MLRHRAPAAVALLALALPGCQTDRGMPTADELAAMVAEAEEIINTRLAGMVAA